MSERVIKRVARPTLVNKTTDWESFRIELQKNINLHINLRTAEQLEKETENFTRFVQTIAYNNTKEVTHTTKGVNYPVGIRELIREKRRARRKWQQTRDPSDKTILNNKTQRLKREIQNLKEETINSYLQNLSAGTGYSLWKATKKIRKPITSISPIRRDTDP